MNQAPTKTNQIYMNKLKGGFGKSSPYKDKTNPYE